MKNFFFLALLLLASTAFAQNTPAPTDIDTLLRGREFKMPRLDSTLRSGNDLSRLVQTPAGKSESDGVYTLQLAALANFDAAQRQREELRGRIGHDIQMVFDAPFYKLRAGTWNRKADAEDRARELSMANIPALVIRLK
jgi:hypothetical protein